MTTARLELGDKTAELPVVVGTENEHAIDISKLRSQTGYITLDEGYRSTGSCKSAITFIDGEKGILRYRGIPIEELAAKSTFVETAMLLIWGRLPTKDELSAFRSMLTEHEMLHEGLHNHLSSFPSSAHPMAILSSMINTVSCYHPDLLEMEESEESFMKAAARLLSKVRTVVAAAYKVSVGQPMMYPVPDWNYCQNFLHMMFSIPHRTYVASDVARKAISQFFILHADHEQNCSTSTVRMVGSSGANLFASCSAGVCALWGWRHGGANTAVMTMLDRIQRGGVSVPEYMEMVKRKEVKLMGFGHRVYKNYDPRARILADSAEKVLAELKVKDPLLDIARRLEERALKDDYFKERNLYPNVDFYSGIILRALGIPVDMFTVMFSIGRMPGWIAHYKEVHDQIEELGIARPRQVYTGPTQQHYVPLDQR